MAETTNEPGQGWADLASILGSYSTAKRQDRQTVGNQTQTFDQLMMTAQQNRDQTEKDALRKLATTGYIGSGGAPYTPATIDFQGQKSTLPSFGFGPKAPSTAQTQGAKNLEGQLTSRLSPGGSYTPTNLESYTKPGAGERIADIGGLVSGGLGAYKTLTGGAKIPGLGFLDKIPGLGGAASGAASGINTAIGGAAGQSLPQLPGLAGAAGGGAASGLSSILGKAAPIAGAATGIYGLLKDRGTKSNIMNGLTAGSSIGTMVLPGIGTAIGAGIGALGGALRGIGGPSKEELAGRESAGAGRQAIASLATPQQIQEAQSAGWQNPQDALTFVVLRDKFGEARASQLSQRLYQAEKQGPAAVQQVLTEITRG